MSTPIPGVAYGYDAVQRAWTSLGRPPIRLGLYPSSDSAPDLFPTADDSGFLFPDGDD